MIGYISEPMKTSGKKTLLANNLHMTNYENEKM